MVYLHGEGDAVLERAAVRLLLGEVVEALDHHEHVVDPDSCPGSEYLSNDILAYRVTH